MKKQNEITVALLLDDIRDAKAVSEVFKGMGVMPFFYESLKTFWYGILDRKPTLSIVDVKKMSEGDRLLKNHPFVKSEKIPLAFFFSKETEPLLISTYNIFHLGLIKKEWSLKNQLQALVIRVNRMLADARGLDIANIRNKTLEGQVTKLLTAFEVGKQELYFQDRLQGIIQQFSDMGLDSDFFSALRSVLNVLPEVEKFTYLELNQAGQKLMTPMLGGKKFINIPSLWLGETCADGVAPFAQEMAQQVCIELMGTELVSLYIKGGRQLPEKIIMIKPSSLDVLNCFDWDGLETFLSGYYSSLQLRFKKIISRKDKYLSPWELLSELDRQFYGQLLTEQKMIPENHNEVLEARERGNIMLINIDLAALVSFIRRGKGVRFYWQNFFEDFVNRLEAQAKINFKTISYGVENINIMAGKEFSAQLFDFIKQFTSQFSYWKYFENTDIALTAAIRPKIEMVPLSPRAYLNFMESQILLDAPEAILYKSAIENFDSEDDNYLSPKKFKSLRKETGPDL